jgi:hypothetical protein
VVRVSFPQLPDFAVDLEAEGALVGLVPDPNELGGPVHVLVGRDVTRFVVLTVDGMRGAWMVPAAAERLLQVLSGRRKS